MKIILSTLSLVLAISAAHAQTYVVERDRNGSRVGTLTQEGNRTMERDRNGDAKGYFVRQGDTIEHRDIQGRRLGTAEIKH